MALYTIADLHLSHGTDKPMNRFGSRWTDHTEKIRTRWQALITDGDTVVIPGDFSWGMTLEEAREDFLFLDCLPGQKIIGKGNHDYWWTSVSKMNAALAGWGVSSVRFLFNNAYETDGVVLCGTRGWFLEEKQQSSIFAADYEKLVHRETLRLCQTIEAGEAVRAGREMPLYVFLHFPPVFGDFICRPMLDVLREAAVTEVFYGHLHGQYTLPASMVTDGVRLTLISADYLDFYPHPVKR